MGDTEVWRRISILDSVSPGAIIGTEHPYLSDISTVVRLMGSITNGYIAGIYEAIPTGRAQELDSIVADSQLIQRLTVENPLPLQIWTSAAQTRLAPRRVSASPSETAFKRAVMAQMPTAKPVGYGMYTSTLVLAPNVSAWWLYLEAYGGSLFPKPWRAYALSIIPGARIYEVVNAQSWVDLVRRHPIIADGLVYPDWQKISLRYDGVHVSWPAIIAIQGVRLVANECLIAESYWDVETTFWLNWSFDNARLINH